MFVFHKQLPNENYFHILSITFANFCHKALLSRLNTSIRILLFNEKIAFLKSFFAYYVFAILRAFEIRMLNDRIRRWAPEGNLASLKEGMSFFWLNFLNIFANFVCSIP